MTYAPPSLSTLNRFAEHAIRPQDGDPLWPATPDIPGWLWRHATPNYWQAAYDGEQMLQTYVIAPRVWGATDVSYTVPDGTRETVDGVTRMGAALIAAGGAYTMGDGAYEVETERLYAPGRRLFDALVEPLAQARRQLDTLPARLYPESAPLEDLRLIADWVDADPLVLSSLPPSMQRRYLHYCRELESLRGTGASAEVLSEIVGAPGSVSLSWHDTVPYRRVVVLISAQARAARVLVRRSIPPHLQLEMHYQTGLSSYTDADYTAPTSDWAPQPDDGDPATPPTSRYPDSALYPALISTFVEVTELL